MTDAKQIRKITKKNLKNQQKIKNKSKNKKYILKNLNNNHFL